MSLVDGLATVWKDFMVTSGADGLHR
jgi:hypothetical protein